MRTRVLTIKNGELDAAERRHLVDLLKRLRSSSSSEKRVDAELAEELAAVSYLAGEANAAERSRVPRRFLGAAPAPKVLAKGFVLGCLIAIAFWNFTVDNGPPITPASTAETKSGDGIVERRIDDVDSSRRDTNRAPGGPHGCRGPRGVSMELALNGILYGLFREGLVPPGDVFDVGAEDGQTGCFFACAAGPDRMVRSVDPSPGNVKRFSCGRPNFRGYLGAVGENDGFLSIGKFMQGQMSLSQSSVKTDEGESQPAEGHVKVPMRRIDRWFDEVFANDTIPLVSAPQLGFAHIDVEGFEPYALKGAEKTIMRDRPFFTVEMHVHKDLPQNIEMLKYINDVLGYRAYIVEEVCGVYQDCRNVLCLPKESVKDLKGSPTLDLAAYSGLLRPVEPGTLEDHAFSECCRTGGACNRKPGGICSEGMVKQWQRTKEGQYFENPINYTQNKWLFDRRFGCFHPKGSLVGPHFTCEG